MQPCGFTCSDRCACLPPSPSTCALALFHTHEQRMTMTCQGHPRPGADGAALPLRLRRARPPQKGGGGQGGEGEEGGGCGWRGRGRDAGGAPGFVGSVPSRHDPRCVVCVCMCVCVTCTVDGLIDPPLPPCLAVRSSSSPHPSCVPYARRPSPPLTRHQLNHRLPPLSTHTHTGKLHSVLKEELPAGQCPGLEEGVLAPVGKASICVLWWRCWMDACVRGQGVHTKTRSRRPPSLASEQTDRSR